MERPEEGFLEDTVEPVKIDKLEEKHVGQVLKYYEAVGDDKIITFRHYLKILHIHNDKYWGDTKTHIEHDWSTNSKVYSVDEYDVHFEPLTEPEAAGKVGMDESDIEKVFASYRSNGGGFVEHIKVLHISKSKFWCAVWIEDKKRWRAEDKVRTRDDARVYVEENRLAWAVLNAAPWFEDDEGEDAIPEVEETTSSSGWIPSHAPQRCDNCDAAWCDECSTSKYLKCDECGHQYYL